MIRTGEAFKQARNTLASLVLETGEPWGEAAADFQWEDALAVLDPNGPPYHFLTRSKSGSKTTDLAGIAIAVMLDQLPPRSRLQAFAADKDQAALLVHELDGFRIRTPDLTGALVVDQYKVTVRETGTVLRIESADEASAHGGRPDFVIVDELAQWKGTPQPRRLWEAIRASMAKMADSRIVIITTAGDPAHWSRRVLDQALESPMWRVHEVPGPAPWLSKERLEEEQRGLPESSYQRLFENRWTAAEDRLVDPDALRKCVTLTDWPLSPRSGHRYTIGVDIGVKNDRTVAAVCHAEPAATRWDVDNLRNEERGTRVVLDRMAVWTPSKRDPVKLDHVEMWVEQAARSYHATVRFDPYQAIGMMQRLRDRSINVEEFPFSQSSVGRLAMTLYTLLRERALALPDDPELLDELANVRIREVSPGVYRMDHDPGRHDDRAIALALAAIDLLTEQAVTTGVVIGGTLYSYDGRIVTPGNSVAAAAQRYGDEDPDFRRRWFAAESARHGPLAGRR